MLVLSRKLEEKIHIGDDITISILRVKGNTVRIGIDAPRTIRVIRGELPVHQPSEAPAPLLASADGDASEDSAADEGSMSDEVEKSGPATTAVRQFIASRARRQHRGPRCQGPGKKSMVAAIARSA